MNKKSVNLSTESSLKSKQLAHWDYLYICSCLKFLHEMFIMNMDGNNCCLGTLDEGETSESHEHTYSLLVWQPDWTHFEGFLRRSR